jgi:hypothetical protein
MSRWGSVKEYATYKGVRPSTIYNAIRAGRVPQPSELGQINFEDADRQWESTLERSGRGGDFRSAKAKAIRAGRGSKGPESSSDSEMPIGGLMPPSLIEAKTKNELIKFQIAELKLAEMKGELISKDLVAKIEFSLGKGYRDVVEQKAVHIAPLVAGKTDLREIEEIIRSEIRAGLNEAAERAERREFVAGLIEDLADTKVAEAEDADDD